jgi:hypothetical protein
MKIANANWRFPSDLQITVSIPWTDAANSTPVADTLAAKLVGSIRYGVNYTRMRMSTPAFRYAVATTEYQNKAKTFIPPQLTFLASGYSGLVDEVQRFSPAEQYDDLTLIVAKCLSQSQLQFFTEY